MNNQNNLSEKMKNINEKLIFSINHFNSPHSTIVTCIFSLLNYLLISKLYLHWWFSRGTSLLFNLTNNVHAFYNVSKNDMFTIQPLSFFSANKELRSLIYSYFLCILFVLPFVFGPQLAMEITPGIKCFN